MNIICIHVYCAEVDGDSSRDTPSKYSTRYKWLISRLNNSSGKTQSVSPLTLKAWFQHKQRKHQMPFPLVQAILLPASQPLSLFPVTIPPSALPCVSILASSQGPFNYSITPFSNRLRCLPPASTPTARAPTPGQGYAVVWV